MTQRHEEQKRERRRAEREKAQSERRLVPLMPILVRLRACEESREWVAKMNFATFQEAWDACPRGGWLAWLAISALGNSDRRERTVWGKHFCYDARYLRDLRAAIPAADVERALYDFAVREGLA